MPVQIHRPPPQNPRAPQNRSHNPLPKHLFPWDTSVAAPDADHLPKNLASLHRRIVPRQRVPARNHLIAANPRNPMQRQAFFAPMQNNLSRPQLPKRAPPHRNHIARPDGWQHTAARHLQANLALGAGYLMDQLAPNSAPSCLCIHNRRWLRSLAGVVALTLGCLRFAA